MRTRIVSAGIGVWTLSAIALAQTGVSGQPGVPTGITTTPDASSSPVPYIPPRPVPHPTPRTSPPPAPAPAPAQAPGPVGPASVGTPAPAPAPPAQQPEPPERERPKSDAFWAPYLSDKDVLDRAIFDLDAQVKARPDDPGLRNDLGNLLARRGFAKEAVEQYRKASKLDREFFLADYNEGLVWEKEGKTSAAIHAYERSIKRKPGFPLSRFHLGFLLEKDGRADAAIREYAKALRIDPSLRWPARNPIVVQTRLLYRASLANYDRDLAGATLADDSSFADRAVWERLHPQRPVDTGELQSEGPEEEEPAVVSAGPSSAPLIGGKNAGPIKPGAPDSRRQQLIDRFRRNRVGRPTPNNPSQTVVAPVAPAPPPAAVPAPPPPEDENAPNPAMQEPPPPTSRS